MAKGLGLKIPLVRGNEGYFETTKTTLETIKARVKSVIMTNPGERVIHAKMGVGLRALLFENDLAKLKIDLISRIEEQFKLYLSELDLDEVRIYTSEEDPNLDDNSLRIKILYSLRGNINTRDQVNLQVDIFK